MTTALNLYRRRLPHLVAAINSLAEQGLAFKPVAEPSTLTDFDLAYASAHCDAKELEWLEFGIKQMPEYPTAEQCRHWRELVDRVAAIKGWTPLPGPMAIVLWPLSAQDDYDRQWLADDQKDFDEGRYEMGDAAL